ncbi:MAG: cryptochrome/photolyase family protein [Brevefilum sp.]
MGITVEVLPNTQFLTNRFDPLPEVEPDGDVRQEIFYRAMRRHFDLLMDQDGEPKGGKWNYDKHNRQPLPDDADPPKPVQFEPDEITLEVIDEISGRDGGFGSLKDFNLAVTPKDAKRAADDFFEQ